MSRNDSKQLAVLVGRAISRQRMHRGLTQEEVAERLGIGTEAVSRIERGVVIPNIARLLEMAEIFGCGAAELLGEVSPLADDQARRVSRLLEPLAQSDQRLVLDLVESLATRLRA
ncbi:DNA-binding transcriptional repressor PuuR [compost metagenome]|jgi:transcriptional regulator with XRE-family HTH domain